MVWTVSLLSAPLGLAGCVYLPPPHVELEGTDPETAWARVLQEHVDKNGRVDFNGIKAAPRDIEVYVAWVSQVSPENLPDKFPTREARLAYYINSYNALAMYNAMRSGYLPESKIRYFYLVRLRVGGEYTSLYHYENDVIRAVGEPRIHFAINCMSKGCPRLPQEPFSADHLEDQLEAASTGFFNDSRHVDVHPQEGIVRFSEILDFYTEDFLRTSPSLIEYANRYHREKISSAYKIEFIPYDFSLNSQ